MKPSREETIPSKPSRRKAKNPYYGDCILVPYRVGQGIIHALGKYDGRKLANKLLTGNLPEEVLTLIPPHAERPPSGNLQYPCALIEYLSEEPEYRTQAIAWRLTLKFLRRFDYAAFVSPNQLEGDLRYLDCRVHAELAKLENLGLLRRLTPSQEEKLEGLYLSYRSRSLCTRRGRHRRRCLNEMRAADSRAYCWSYNVLWEPLN